jgi:hypothetical protein
MALQIRRGTNAERLTFTPLQGELIYTTDTKAVFVGDGVTQGGTSVGGESGSSNAFSTVSVTGQSNIVASGASTLRFAAGSNITLTTNPGTGTVTISSTAGGGGATSLDGLLDVAILNPQLDQIIKYNGTTWVNETIEFAGGGIDSLQDDATPTLGGNLNLNSNNINGTGNINIVGTLTSTDLKVSDSLNPILTIAETSASVGTVTMRENSDLKILANTMFVGDLTKSTSLRIFTIDVANTEALSLRTYFNGGIGTNDLTLIRARGVGATPVAVQPGDQIYRIKFKGYDGATFTETAQIFSEVDGPVNSGVVPGNLKFATADSLGVIRSAMTINSSHVVNVNYGLNTTGGDVNLINSNPNFLSFQTDQAAKVLSFTKYRGSAAAPATVSAGDYIYSIRWSGYNGEDAKISSQIRGEVGSTVSGTAVSGRLRLMTADSSGNLKTSLEITDDQTAQFNYAVLVNGGNLTLQNSSTVINTTDVGQATKFFTFRKARGTTETPLAVETGDFLYQLRWSGYDGAGYFASAQVRAEADSTISTGIVSGRLKFLTADTSGAMTTAMEIGDDQLVKFNKGFTMTGASANIEVFNNAQGTNTIVFRKARGTQTVPAAVQNNDYLYALRWSGFDGADYFSAAQIRGEIDGTVSTGVVPGRLRLQATNSTGTVETTATFGNTRIQLFKDVAIDSTTETAVEHRITGTARLLESVAAADYSQVVSNAAEVFTAYAYASSTYRAAKFVFTVTRGSGDVRIQEVLVANTSSTVSPSYATPTTIGDDPLSAVLVDYDAGSGGQVRLRLTTDTGNLAEEITKVTVQVTLFRS